MPKLSALLSTPPAAVSAALARLGEHLRVARTRRGLSQRGVAKTIGVGMRAVMEAEAGHVSTSVGVYVALLQHYGLGGELGQLADPNRDLEGLRQGGGRTLRRARRTGPQQAQTPVPPPSPLPRETPPPSGDDEALLGLPGAVLSQLERTGLLALRLLQQHSAARTTELARALGISPSRVGGLMRTLKQQLHGQGFGGVLAEERLDGGESLYRFTRGSRA